MKRQFPITFCVAILFAALGAYFGNLHAHAESSEAASSKELFSTSLPDLKNVPQPLGQWKGKVLLVNFWATWCGPCVQEMPELSALQSEGKIAKLQIIGIGVDSAANMLAFSDKYKISYPLYVAGVGGSELLRKLGDRRGGLPYSILISPNGEVKKTYEGRLNMNAVKRDIAAM